MPATHEHLIGLLLGAENDWPAAFEGLARKLGVVTAPDGGAHRFTTERLTIEPFNLRDRPRQDLVIDRLAHWYYHPREWLKKVALMDDVYLLNSPFTFQSMEKHSAYCAMMRLGMKVPETVLVPYKNPVDNARWAFTSAKYNKAFDLDRIADELGYPMYMKPFDGGAWRGVSMIRNREELHRSYDDSGEMLMHLQKAVDGFDVFARALTIGPETMMMKFRPELPMHDRYAVEHGFLGADVGAEAVTIAQTVNAFFRWEFNSCEMLVKNGVVYPIDYANACPDVAVTSLHYYFPWAMKALLRWSVYCLATGRQPRTQVDTGPWFSVADDESLDYAGKLAAYQRLAELRRSLPQLTDPSFASVSCTADETRRVFTMRRSDLLLAVNFGDDDAELVVDGDLAVLFRTPIRPSISAGRLALPPHAGMLLGPAGPWEA